ncbi:3-hydroxyacyl-CoA dehydrogenase NAD-binding domain-containing protein [Streptomyces sp. NPDC057199]|uniref:3-hydroxyacyl-CoA dehydrogenase NAD-binding domain-containing protein n=1 Tax=Streptomyces sp. NPDC057199 TaxID=3346047 RepID=UPI00363FD6B4
MASWIAIASLGGAGDSTCSARNDVTRPSPGCLSLTTSATWPTASFVVETVAENRDIKIGVLQDLGSTVADLAAVLATNISSISIVDLAVALERRGRLIGMHLFTVRELIEFIPPSPSAPRPYSAPAPSSNSSANTPSRHPSAPASSQRPAHALLAQRRTHGGIRRRTSRRHRQGHGM